MTTGRWDELWLASGVATLAAAGPWGAIDDGAVAIRDGRIAWVGRRADLSAPVEQLATRLRDLGAGWITPSLVDCHTHLVWGGSRVDEFERRLAGESYESIARGGGGILSTVRATRAASEAQLLAGALARLDRLRAEGVTTVEVKSGYGLDIEGECAMLRVARRLGVERPVDVVTTFLGAHAVPPEFRAGSDGVEAYVDLVAGPMLDAVVAAGLADRIDAFCEGIAFSPAQVEHIFCAGAAQGLARTLHAEQLSNLGGAALAARLGAQSADHLEYLDEGGVAAMAAAGTVAVLLPGAFLVLRETKVPPVDLLRSYGVPIAVASDCNPGSSPIVSLLANLTLASVLFRLTPAEAFAGATREAARALGLTDRGTIAVGQRADLAFWRVERPAAIVVEMGMHRPELVVRAGAVVVETAC